MGPNTRSSTQDKQARIDRSGAAEGQAESSSPSSGQGSPATLLDLSDAHGLIYQLLPDSQSRAAFRQCSKTIYMSPSINAHLKALNFGSIEWRAQPLHRKKGSSKRYGTREKWDSDRYAPRTIKDAIVKFPKHATLKQLLLIGGSRTVKINFRKFLSKAEALDPVSEATRRRLRTVNSVHTQADCLNIPDAERLTSLLPQLEELRLQDTPYSNDFFGTIAAGQNCNVTSLELRQCKSSEGPGTAMEGVSLMTSLRSLKLDYIAYGTQLSPLARLQNLKHLSLSNFQPAGLGHVVSSLPLEILDLDNLNSSYLKLPAGEVLASSTLTTLCFRGDLTDHSDWLLALKFPCLKILHFKSEISFSLLYGSPESQEVLDRMERVAGWLGRQGLTWIGKVDCFRMSCCTTYNYSQPGMSASFCAALVKRLIVMAHQLGSICKLSLDDIKLSHASLSDIAALFPHVSHITFSKMGLCSPLRLPELLASLPLLSSVQVNGGLDKNMGESGVQGVAVRDLLALLCTARDERRELSLCVPGLYNNKWSELKAAWEAEASKHPPCAFVKLFKAADHWCL